MADIIQALKRSRKTWFARVRHIFDRPTVDDEMWDELEEVLIGADVGVNTAGKLIGAVRDKADRDKLNGSQVWDALKTEMVNVLKVAPQEEPTVPLPPRVSLFVGVNGGGKTTSIAKYAHRLRRDGKEVLLVAADTFRAAAIDQLKKWGQRAGVSVIAHQPGADPGAVVYDALQAARSRQVEEVIIDTAGRLHTKYNLMEELKKIKRVAAKMDEKVPHEVVLVIDATTGQNGLTQAKYFTDAVGVSGIFLAKLDGTARGGIVFAICDELQIPVKYIGTGEKLEDMADFDAEAFVDALCVIQE